MGVPTRRWAPGAFQHGNKDVDPTRLQFQKHLGPNEEGQNEPWSNVQISWELQAVLIKKNTDECSS